MELYRTDEVCLLLVGGEERNNQVRNIGVHIFNRLRRVMTLFWHPIQLYIKYHTITGVADIHNSVEDFLTLSGARSEFQHVGGVCCHKQTVGIF